MTKTETALGHVIIAGFKWAVKSPVVMGLIGLSIGGGGSQYMNAQREDPRIDTIMVSIRAIKPMSDTLQAHGEGIRAASAQVDKVRADVKEIQLARLWVPSRRRDRR